ncbi:hypothetical protein [Streptomyces sp. NPDC057413]|uniref:hypothetical protein n=1 Tax=Streptomyces sp. NPDC057413 TaxID=3346124 RepID=UPI003699F2CB
MLRSTVTVRVLASGDTATGVARSVVPFLVSTTGSLGLSEVPCTVSVTRAPRGADGGETDVADTGSPPHSGRTAVLHVTSAA